MNKLKSLLKTNKRFTISLLIAIVLCISLVTISFITDKSYATSGTYGTCAWDIDANGKLTLAPQSGNNSCTLGSVGSELNLPWYSNRADVLTVEIAQGVTPNADSSYLFSDLSNATSIDLTYFDTSNVTKMYNMFRYCSSLTSLDVTHFDTSSVTNMGCMFANCSSLTSLDVTHFDTSHATSMKYMFYFCTS